MKSLLAPWIGGAASPGGGGPGYKSLLAFWMGGAGYASPTQSGVRSLLAFWAGGAASSGEIPPTPVDEEHLSHGQQFRHRRERKPEHRRKPEAEPHPDAGKREILKRIQEMMAPKTAELVRALPVPSAQSIAQLAFAPEPVAIVPAPGVRKTEAPEAKKVASLKQVSVVQNDDDEILLFNSTL